MAGGGTLQLGLQTDETWANLGTVSVTGSTLNISGGGAAAGKPMTQASLGIIDRDAASTVKLATNFTLTGDLNLDDSTGSWQLAGAELKNGAINTAGSARLIGVAVAGGNSYLTNETINGNLDLTTGNTNLYITGGLTINSTLNVGDTAGSFSTQFNVRDDQIWSGTGTIVFGGAGNSITSGVSKSLTIDGDLTVRGKKLTIDSSLTSLTNLGTIAADSSGGLFDISAKTISNQGTASAAIGAELRLHPTTTGFVNLTGQTLAGSIYSATLTGGTWLVGAGSTLRVYFNNTTGIRITGLNAALALDGGGSNVYGGQAGGSFATFDALGAVSGVSADGSLAIASGRILTTVGDFMAAGNVTIGTDSSLNPVPTLVSQWTGENSPGDAAYRNPATLSGGASYATGHSGQGFFFPGGSGSASTAVVSVPDSASLRVQPFTVSAWVNPTAFGNSAVILGKETTSGSTFTGGFALYLSSTTGRPAFYAGTQIVSSTSLPLNTWSHLLASFDGQASHLYVNGVEVGNQTFSQPLVTTQPMSIGNNSTGIFPFHGTIDDATFFNRALTPAEAALLSPGPASYTQMGGTLSVLSGGSIMSLNGAGQDDILTLQGGTLEGTGTVNADVTNNAGIVAPGNSPGFLDITGNYVQGPGGTLNLEIAGRDPNVPEFDRLRVTGTASIAGNVHVDLLDGFQPAPGDEFQVVSSGGLTLQPALAYQLPAPGGPLRELAQISDSLNLTLRAQQIPPINFDSATTGGGTAPGQMTPYHVELDAAGNTYVTGEFVGTVDFDKEHASGVLTPDTLTAASANRAAFLAKYATDGQLIWVYKLDTPNAPTADPGNAMVGFSLAIDSRGNVNAADDLIWVVGRFRTEATFTGPSGQTILGNGNSLDAFVLRVDATGAQQLLMAIGGTQDDIARGVALAPDGGVFVSGAFQNTVDFDPGTGTANLTSAGNFDAYVLQLDPSGNFVRVGRLGGPADDRAVDVASDGAGDVWAVGYFRNTTTGLATLSTIPAGADRDAFVLKLEPNGTGFTATVAQQYGAEGVDEAHSVAIDADGNVIVGGSFQLAVDFDQSSTGAFTLTSGGDDDVFILKLDSGGGFLWARQMGGYRSDALADLAIDSQGNIYSTGSFIDTVDFDPLDGTYYLSTAPQTNPQGFVQKLDSSGKFVWAAQVGEQTTSNVNPNGIAVDAAGRVVSVGSFAGDVDFDPTDGTAIRTADAGTSDGYSLVLSQKAAPSATIVGVPSASLNEGSTLALAASVSDSDSAFFTYAWSVTRGETVVASGTGPALAAYLTDQGTYTVTLTVSDESGNSDTKSATVVVNNSAPVLNPTTFDTGSALLTGAASTDNLGSAIAVSNGYVLTGAPLSDSGATDAGTASLRKPDGTVLSLSAPTATANARFGSAVAIVGNYAIVGGSRRQLRSRDCLCFRAGDRELPADHHRAECSQRGSVWRSAYGTRRLRGSGSTGPHQGRSDGRGPGLFVRPGDGQSPSDLSQSKPERRRCIRLGSGRGRRELAHRRAVR